MRTRTTNKTTKAIARAPRGAVSGFYPRTEGAEAEPAREALPAREAAPLACFGGVSSHNLEFAAVLQELERVAPTDLVVLLVGESGTGKELLARAVHAESPRRSGPFVAINCAALPEQLAPSELFGHVRGAFTGAESDRRGAFQSASGGTLLLDEIGDAPLAVQLALLRVLEQGTVRPVGSDREVRVDVRVIAATSRRQEELLGEGAPSAATARSDAAPSERRSDAGRSAPPGHSGALRRDLYYRLAEVVLRVPPLRERPEDVASLTRQLLAAMEGVGPGAQHGSNHGSNHGAVRLSPEALARLRVGEWLGNVRELRSALRRAVALLGRGECGAARVLGVEHFQGVRAARSEAQRGGGGASERGASERGGLESGALEEGSQDRGSHEHASGAQAGREPFVFPSHVRELAERLERKNGLVSVKGVSRQLERAHLRAALLCLAQMKPRAEWPAELRTLWIRLFRAGWETAEGGRGRRELERVMGVDAGRLWPS